MSGLGAEYPNMPGWNGYPSLTPPVSDLVEYLKYIRTKTN